MTRPEAIEIARKLKALIESAVDHEKVNATEKLKRFCQRHGLNEEEYSTTTIKVSIAYKNVEERTLLSNVMCMILETDNIKGSDKNGALSFQCSPHEFDLIKDAYAYYRSLYREYCEAVLIALVTKNQIINTRKNDKPFEMDPMTKEEKEKLDEKMKEISPPESPTKNTETKDGAAPTQSKVDQEKLQERISKFLFVMEPNKWNRPVPRAKLFLH